MLKFIYVGVKLNKHDFINLTAYVGVKLNKHDFINLTAWNTKLGRRDSKTASKAAAESGAIPSPTSNLSQLIDLFSKNNLTKQDLVVLSGGHTIGKTRCTVFRSRIYNESDINKSFAENAKQGCPVSSGDDNLEPLDLSTPENFDTNYFQHLMEKQTLLHYLPYSF
ncbi:peroxidase 52 [Phtheirospermum japonicum]|uniref:peroxidase n=1 Tax=Phtheirospermum japonicum TaxID=374723 RepID=A0A830BH35_9LAMI|nr:peroxidase 52 [Phtheirospermum japonicum]